MSVTSKAGWAPLPGGYQRMALEFPFELSVAVDKTAWDWTMPEWVIRAYVDMKLDQCIDPTDDYEELIWQRLNYVLGPGTRFRMSSGVEWRQTYWGLMKSGWLLTLSMNSAAQAFQHALAWRRAGLEGAVPPMWAMGDDTLCKMPHDHLGEYEAALKTCGCLVKKVVPAREFAGFELTSDGKVVPLYPDKHQFILRYLEPDVECETVFAYSLLYALAGESWFDEIASRCPLPPKIVQQSWARGLTELSLLGRMPKWTLE